MIDENDKEKPFPDEDSAILKVRKLSDLKIGYLPVAKGAFFLGYSISDLNGNFDVEDVEVVVKDFKKND